MSQNNLADVTAVASGLLGKDRRLALDYLAESRCINLEWYLKKKIIEAADEEEMLDNTRPLKYALNFCRGNAQVTLLREQESTKTPDLMVEMDELGITFFLDPGFT